MSTLCDEAELTHLLEEMKQEAPDVIARAQTLASTYPEDARLQFLLGSMLVGAGRLIEAHDALARAVELAPDFALARFQLGFFLLTSGEANRALDIWGRLDQLPNGHYLRHFVDGLRALTRDDFVGAIEKLRAGMALNQENPPLNRDMQLLIDRCLPLLNQSKTDDNGEPVSETSLILQHFASRNDAGSS